MNSTNTTQSDQVGFIETIKLLRDVRPWRIFVLGMASGYPWVLIGASLLNLWLADEGFVRRDITLFALCLLPYNINFLWAPLLDAIKFKWLGNIGQRRSWILVCQIGLFVFTVGMAIVGPSPNIVAFASLAVGIAFLSATQDLAIDAYRVTVIRRDEESLIGLGAAMATSGWWVGLGVPGALLLYLSDFVSWNHVYVAAALMLVPMSVVVLLWFEEPKVEQRALSRNWILSVALAYFDTVVEFFKRNGFQIAISLLGFILLFKIGEAFLGRTVYLFYDEVGYTNSQIATFSKLIGTTITVVFALLAAAIMPRFGVFKMLFFSGIAMAATNLMFSWIAVEGPKLYLFLAAVICDGITSAIATVAFVTFLTYYVNHLHAAGQYGALASLGNFNRNVLVASSGLVVDSLGGNWALFFVITAVAVTPSLGILAWIAHIARRSERVNE